MSHANPDDSLDAETDNFIQKTLREELTDATLICIAHRLDTIIEYADHENKTSARALTLGFSVTTKSWSWAMARS